VSGKPAAILDIDGTLVDTNYHHAIAWYRAFRQSGEVLPLWRIHRHIGMGGDQLVAALAGEEFEAEHGDDVRAAEKVLYMDLIGEVQPFTDARPLMEDLRERGHALVLASSAKPDEVEHYLDLLDARELAQDWTDSGDVERTKPEPDLVAAAVEKAGGGRAVMIGDSTWDPSCARTSSAAHCPESNRASVPSRGRTTGSPCATSSCARLPPSGQWPPPRRRLPARRVPRRIGGCSSAITAITTRPRASSWSSASCRSRGAWPGATGARTSRSTTSCRSPHSG
jgi:HAD superfamily hydrolase (TIGR01549 family)